MATVQQVCAEVGARWHEVDISDDPQLTERYTDQVPVTLVDGAQHDFWRVDAERLRAALTSGDGDHGDQSGNARDI